MKPSALTQEEWEVDTLLWETGHICADCGEDLHVLDELVLLQVVRPNYDERGELHHDTVQAKGGYAYEPQFFHVTCWSTVWENLLDFLVDDQRAVPSTAPHLKVATCDSCFVDIYLGETVGLLNVGEVRRSCRAPSGESTIYFNQLQAPHHICTACLATLNEELFKMWKSFTHAASCAEGVQERCWRTDTCTYDCHHVT